MTHQFLPLLIITLLAFFIPVFLSRVRAMPIVVGEILAGIIIGPSLLNLISADEHTLELLSEIGFAFLMFLSGLEIDFSFLKTLPNTKRSRLENPVFQGFSIFLLTLGMAFLAALGFQRAGYVPEPWMMTLILSTTSLGIVVPVLKERHLIASQLGQTLLISALIADFLTMFLITVYVTVHLSGLSFEILLIMVLFPPLLFLAALFKNLQRTSLWKMVNDLSGGTSQIKVRGAFVLMMAFVVLAEALGVELILGAFLGGVLATLVIPPEDDEGRHKLDAIGYGFFIPIFFINVGIQFDLQAFLNAPGAWIMFPAMILAAFAIKLLATLLLKFRFSWRETFASGFLLSARLSLIVAASAIGLRLGVISEAVNASIILTAVLTASFSPLLFNFILPHTHTQKESLHIIFSGSGLALQTGRYLHAHGDSVGFYAASPDQAAQIKQAGFSLLGTPDTSFADVLENLNAKITVQSLLTLSEEDALNLQACQIGQTHGIKHIIAFSNIPAHIPDYRACGARVLTPTLYRTALLGLMARTPSVFDLLTTTDDNKVLVEINLSNPALDGKALRELALPPGVLILVIHRKDELIVPHGHTHLHLGDQISIVGAQETIEKAQGFFAAA